MLSETGAVGAAYLCRATIVDKQCYLRLVMYVWFISEGQQL